MSKTGTLPLQKGIWWKEWRQVASMGLVFVLTLLVWTLNQTASSLERVGMWVEKGLPIPTPTPIGVEWPVLLLAGFALALGVLQMGSERNGLDRFTFFLPYPRAKIFFVKFALGTAIIGAAILIAAGANVALYYSSPMAAHVAFDPDWAARMGLVFLDVVTFYALVLFMGALAGTPYYQIALSLIFGVYVAGAAVLFRAFLIVHLAGLPIPIVRILEKIPFLTLLDAFATDEALRFLIGVSPLMHGLSYMFSNRLPIGALTTDLHEAAWAYLPYDAILLALFVALGALAYRGTRLELSGRMLVLPKVRPLFLWAVPLHFGLLAGYVSILFSNAEGPLSPFFVVRYDLIGLLVGYAVFRWMKGALYSQK
ncbi:MAG: hypothetical protein KM310_10185 [Clostridiales bacterium]|nr:hypothetical protein [Clostridiales bacterium]